MIKAPYSSPDNPIFWIVGVIIGFGPWLPMNVALLAVVLYIVAPRLGSIRPSGTLAFQILLLIGFSLLYLLFDNSTIDQGIRKYIEIGKFLLFVIAAILMIVLINNRNDATSFLLAISCGLLLHATVFVGATIIMLDPPYYGRIYSPLSGEMVNSPNYSNKAAYFAFTLLVVTSLKQHQINQRIIAGLYFFALPTSLLIGILLGGRSYFVAVISVTIFLLIIRFWHRRVLINAIIGFIMIALADILLSARSHIYLTAREFFQERLLAKGLSDEGAREYVQSAWVQQFMEDPFGQIYFPLGIETQWFHNFWLDAHYFGGFFIFSLSVAILILPCFYLARMFTIDRATFFAWFSMLGATFFLMSSSVPMYSEQSAVFFLFTLSMIIVKFGNRSRTRKKVRLRLPLHPRSHIT